MWTPDIRTIFLMIFLVNAFLTLMIVACWKTQKTYNGFALWAISLLFQSCAYLLFMLRDSVPDLLSILIANTLSMLAMIMRIDAIRRFFWSKPIPVWYYTLLIPIFTTYCYFTYVTDSIVMRALITTVFIVPCLFIAGWLALSSHEQENRMLRYLFAASLTIPSLVLIVRLVAWMIIGEDLTIFSNDAFNTVFFLIAIIADILATGFFLMLNMVRSQMALRQTNEKLNLLSGITRHDIRNQLHALSGYLELSRQSVHDPARQLELIGREEKIANAIDHQINFARDYEEVGVMAPAWQNVDRIVRQAMASLPLKDIRVVIDRSDLEVYADPLFCKVFHNLIDNALRYGGGKMTTIHVSSHETGTGLIITCADDGVGITDEDKAHLFEKGYGKHTGLGLFLSHEILAITGITIAETGEPEKGARFEITVPEGAFRFM